MARVRTWPARTVEWEQGIASQNIWLLARMLAQQGWTDAGIQERLRRYHGPEMGEDVRGWNLRVNNAVRFAGLWRQRMFGFEGAAGNPRIERAWMYTNPNIDSTYRYTVIFHWGQPGQPGFEARTVVVNSQRLLRRGEIHEHAANVFNVEAQRYERFRGFDPFGADFWQVLNAEKRTN